MKVSIRALRVNAGLKQQEVAKKMGVNVGTIRNWERLSTFPDALQLKEMCSIYKCSLDDIFLPDNFAKSEIN